MQIQKKYILITTLLIIITAFVASALKKPELTTTYPPVHALTRTDNLICEAEISNRIGAYDTCDEKKTSGFIMAGKQNQAESMRVGQTEQWIRKEAVDKPKIKYRTENGIIHIKDVRLIKEIEDREKEKQYKIVSEDDKYITAQLLESAPTATSSATLFLDKSKGLLMINNISTYLFCGESVNSGVTLYSCQEN